MKHVRCYHCGSENLKKNGKAPNGKQRYHCKACNRASLENPDYSYSEARKDEIIRIRNAQVGGGLAEPLAYPAPLQVTGSKKGSFNPRPTRYSACA
jgi:hypothetical protein